MIYAKLPYFHRIHMTTMIGCMPAQVVQLLLCGLALTTHTKVLLQKLALVDRGITTMASVPVHMHHCEHTQSYLS
ncbi:hypothetical protein K503DRAFT_378409 [Rhizopogon vinicolor AM-OR11-026]|uniref:Uncharacterized protein n=1 Tax=Rhizopogon vinicolor AM-OR11-026 TaxID=1314800 RepID=A0A1B7MRS3_9AGAM|nr:hypothetical protein K503DRAFT_378409 [Rhizopogon vinicolor AM-OR11-026]